MTATESAGGQRARTQHTTLTVCDGSAPPSRPSRHLPLILGDDRAEVVMEGDAGAVECGLVLRMRPLREDSPG